MLFMCWYSFAAFHEVSSNNLTLVLLCSNVYIFIREQQSEGSPSWCLHHPSNYYINIMFFFFFFFFFLIKVDLKGLPSFMMYQVLKRYPLLLRDIRQYFSSPRVSPSPTHTALDASISSTWIQELTLGTSSSVTENFEDAVPCQHYIHHNITKTKDEYWHTHSIIYLHEISHHLSADGIPSKI